MDYQPTPAQLKLRKLISGPAKHVMAYGGARSGKTFEILNNLCAMASIAGGRYAIFRARFNTVRTAVFLASLPQVLKTCFPKVRATLYRGADLYYSFPSTGGEIWGLGLDDAERVDKVLGKEFTAIYFNECSEISYHAIETAITRCSQKTLGIKRNKVFYDCNPPYKTHWAHRLFIEKVNPVTLQPLKSPNNYVACRLNPVDNAENLPQGYIDELKSLTPDKQKRFLYGEWQDDNPDALFTPDLIETARRLSPPPEWDATSFIDGLDKIVIGVDPAVTGNEKSDLTGIVIAGVRYYDGKNRVPHYYILADKSMKAHPSVWAAEVNSLFNLYNANEVVVETNQGGELVTETLRNMNYALPITPVRATNNKRTRAEPVAALYLNGVVHHTAIFGDLEEQLCSYTGTPGEKSPDRMDALVWALSALAESKTSVTGGRFWFI